MQWIKRLLAYKTLLARLFVSFSLLSILAGCATPWEARIITDKFSDYSLCRVAQYQSAFAQGASQELSRQMGYSGISYLFVAEMHDSGPRIGVKSSHNVPIVGELQIRVDDYPVVSVLATETPVDLGGTAFKMPEMPGTTAATRKQLENAFKSAAGYMSPLRLASGAKASVLLEQIAHGQRIRFRTVGVNALISTTAEFDITVQFLDALKECELI